MYGYTGKLLRVNLSSGRKLDTLLDEYYNAFGYTRQGVPTVERLGELGLHGVIKDMEKFVS